jgi:hypothetical protein
LFFLVIKHLWRNEAAEFSLDQFGQLQRRRVLQPGPDDLHANGSPSGAKPVGVAVVGKPGNVAIPGQASWSG